MRSAQKTIKPEAISEWGRGGCVGPKKQAKTVLQSQESWVVWKERVVGALLFLWWCLVLWACLKVAFWIIGWLRHGFLVLIGME